MSDIFDILSGGGGRGGGRQRERRGENVVHRLKVSLEEVYNGGTRSGLPANLLHISGMSRQWKEHLLYHGLSVVTRVAAVLLACGSSLGRAAACGLSSWCFYDHEGTALHSNSAVLAQGGRTRHFWQR